MTLSITVTHATSQFWLLIDRIICCHTCHLRVSTFDRLYTIMYHLNLSVLDKRHATLFIFFRFCVVFLCVCVLSSNVVMSVAMFAYKRYSVVYWLFFHLVYPICQFLWIVHFRLPLLYSLTFISSQRFDFERFIVSIMVTHAPFS